MGKELWVGWMRQFQLHGLLKREPRNRRMLVRLLISRCPAPCLHEIHIILDLFFTFRNRLQLRFEMYPLRWRDPKLFLQLTDQGLLRLLAWLDVPAKDIPDAGVKASRRRALS